jgi:hypothetical protein
MEKQWSGKDAKEATCRKCGRKLNRLTRTSDYGTPILERTWCVNPLCPESSLFYGGMLIKPAVKN